jgi:hypothetical protein
LRQLPHLRAAGVAFAQTHGNQSFVFVYTTIKKVNGGYSPYKHYNSPKTSDKHDMDKVSLIIAIVALLAQCQAQSKI